MSAEKYGNLYFGIETANGNSMVFGDAVSVSNAGDLMVVNHASDGSMFYGLILASGEWRACAAASVIDGKAIIVERQDESEAEDGADGGDVKTFAQTERAKMTPSLRYRILQRDGFRCKTCGRGADDVVLHVDHITPVSKNGLTVEENLQVLCVDCNLGKGVNL